MPRLIYIALAIIVIFSVAIIIFSSKIPGSVTGLEATQEVSQKIEPSEKTGNIAPWIFRKIDSAYVAQQRQAAANVLVTVVTYVQDPRTGICFACLPDLKNNISFSIVPRERIPDSLLVIGEVIDFTKK